MNDSLTIYLAILGGAVLAAVVAHGAWTSRKMARLAPKRAGLEPVAGDADLSMADTVPTDLQGDDGPEVPALPQLRKGGARLDALVDAIATISLEHPLTGDMILAHMPSTRRAGSKPMLIEGLRTDCAEWEAPQAGVTYSELQAGVLLANRTGALNEIEYSEFVQKVQTMADGLGGGVVFPDMLDVVAHAKELDQFGCDHDAQLALRLYARGSAWSVGYVQQQAARHGFVPGALPGRLVLPASEEGAPPVLTLQFDAQAAFADDPDQSTLREVVLAFDVPQTSEAQEPFKAWCAAGEALSMALDAAMVDDQGNLFTPAAFASIEGELTRLYQALSARDLAAGSPATRRLFR